VVLWDDNLDMIIAFASVTVPDPAPPTVDMGDILVNDWFAHMQGYVFFDTNQNGFKDPGEAGIPEQVVISAGATGASISQQPPMLQDSMSFMKFFRFLTGWWPKSTLHATRPPAPLS